MFACPVSSRTKTQDALFQAFKDRLEHFDERQRVEASDPWVFHGTSALKAAWIRREGFRGLCADGVFWGRAAVATYFARNNSIDHADDRPVVIACRLSKVLASGKAGPDINWDHKPEPKTWNESLEATGCMLVHGGYHVEGLRFLEPYGRDLPLPPQAFKDREERLLVTSFHGYGMVPVLPEEAFTGLEQVCAREEIVVAQWALDMGYDPVGGWPRVEDALPSP